MKYIDENKIDICTKFTCLQKTYTVVLCAPRGNGYIAVLTTVSFGKEVFVVVKNLIVDMYGTYKFDTICEKDNFFSAYKALSFFDKQA